MLSKIKSLGPGLLYAGAAIGVSHLVQSTRAGASYGYVLIIAIILAHVFKYPFFVLGPRYAEKKQVSLIQGFAGMGNWAIWLVGILTLSTMFTIQAAVTIVTAGLIQKITNLAISPAAISCMILMVCLLILRIGKFKVLDQLMKVVMVVLSLTTIAAFVLSFQSVSDITANFTSSFTLKNSTDLDFLITFVGWMPAPLDIAIWHSIWTLTKSQKSQSNSDLDFKIGFYGTAFLGICFLVLGANTLYGSDTELVATSGGFASQLIDMFVVNLGPGFYGVIAIAAFTTMFSTTITCLDAMPRVMNEIWSQKSVNSRNTTSGWQLILVGGTVSVLLFFMENMKQMVSFATTISFLTAPILAWLCYQVVVREKDEDLWSDVEQRLACMGIVVLGVLSLVYVFV